MKAQTIFFFASSILLVACGGNDPNPGGSGGTSSAVQPGSSEPGSSDPATGDPPPPHTPCPSHEPAVGSACAPNGAECTYGVCSDPNGDVELECESGKWAVIGGGACGSADAGGPPDASKSCSSGGMANANGVCSADLAMFQSAEQGCSDGHQVLTSFTADEKCGAGSSDEAQFTCCAAQPAGCSQGGMANGNGLCSSDDSFFASAEQGCAELHETIVGFSSDEKCGAGSSNSATFTCCP